MIVQDRTRKSVLNKSSKYLKSINKLHKEYNGWRLPEGRINQ